MTTVTVEDIPPHLVRTFVRYLYSDKLDASTIANAERHMFMECVGKIAPERLNSIRQLMSIEPIEPNNSKEMLWAVANTKFHDVVFVVGESEETKKRIAAHKVVLCARSPYFKAMLMGSLKVCVDYAA